MLKRINWTNTLFIVGIHLIAVIGTIWLIASGKVHTATAWLAFALFYITGLGATAGYHRLFSHRSYEASWPLKLLLLLFAAAGFEGSAMEWSTDHRRHHLYVDTDKDPYNINRGFWYAHIGWLFVLDPKKRDFNNVKDLANDRLVYLQHRFFVPIAIFMGILLPIGIASLWGDPLGGLILAVALRIVALYQVTFCVNSVCHLWGERTYADKQTARDNWFTAYFTFGEGFHNFHHQFMFDYRNGVRFYHFDSTKWLIRICSFLGLAKNLKRAGKKQLIQYRIKNEEHRLLKHTSEMFKQHLAHLALPLCKKIVKTASYFEQLEEDYKHLKAEKKRYIAGKMEDYRQLLSMQKNRLKATQLRLKILLDKWRDLTRNQISPSLRA